MAAFPLRALALGLLGIAVCACDDTSPPTPAPAASTRASAGAASTCATDAARLAKWSREAVAEGSGPPRPVADLKVDLVESAAGEQWPWFGTALYIDEKRLQLDFGEPVEAGNRDGMRRLGEELSRAVRSALAAGMSARVDLFVDRDAPWSSVSGALLAASRAGFRTVGFAFARKSRLEPPEASDVAGQLAAAAKEVDAGTASVALQVFASCPGARQALTALTDESVSQKERASGFAARVPPAYEACGCKPKLADAQAVLWQWLGRAYGPPVAAVETRIAAPADQKASRVSAAPDASWKSVHAELLAKAKEGGPLAFGLKQ